MDRQFDGRRAASGLRLGVPGEHLAVQLHDALAAESSADQQRLTAAFEEWSINEIRRTGRRPSEHLMQQLRVAALGPTLRGSRTSLSSWSSSVLEAPQSPEDDERAAENTAVVENAQRARNLISHRRKVVRGVLRAITEAGDDSTPRKPAPGGSRSSRPQREPLPEHLWRAEQLRGMRVDNPLMLGDWARQCFELYVDVQRVNTRWSSALANNHKAEWLDFLLLLAPDMVLDEDDTLWLRKRHNFEERFSTALHLLRVQASKPGIEADEERPAAQWLAFDTPLEAAPDEPVVAAPQQAPAASEPAQQPVPAGYRSMFAGVAAAAVQAALPEPEPQVAAASAIAAQLPAAASPAASIGIIRTAQGITLTIDADAYGVRDLEETAFTLSLTLLDPSDPTEVRVRAIPGPPRQIEMTLGSLDVAKGFAARHKLLELLGAKPTA